ncbi:MULTISPECIES: rhodanese-like domain-containing protein [Myxococcaceae]|uniref:rhodanese-like domain-containing protein n=1 Tax=Myxococcaceae TaxID=31 RepID=UPI001E572176|nr:MULTISPECIES: rhodanese-like domain-containing protein [Myxococcaceae]
MSSETAQTLSQKARAMVEAGAALIDVRTPEEFREGHVPGARNIPVQELARRLAEVGPPGTPVVVYCRAGARAASAAELLQRAGYPEVLNLVHAGNW